MVFARTGEAPGSRGLSAFLVEADTPGLRIAERISVIAPHPLATLVFENCVIPAGNLLGAPGEGFKVAMATLDVFRPTVGAAALGLARRAMDEAVHRATTRKMFGSDAGGPADDPGQDRRHGAGNRHQRLARLPRRMDARRAAAGGSPARRRWPSCTPPKRRNG